MKKLKGDMEYKELASGEALKASFEDRILRQLGLYESNCVAEMGRLQGFRGDIEIGTDEKLNMPVFITNAVSNIPFIPFTPAKRLSVIGHSLRTAGEWENEEKQLYDLDTDIEKGALFHNVSTLNARISFAETEEENLLTEDDAIIISPAFAKRASYRLIYRALEEQSHPLLIKDIEDGLELGKEIKVTKGDYLLPQYKDSDNWLEKFLYEESRVRQSGVLIPREIMPKKKKIVMDSNGEDMVIEEVFFQRYNIIQAGNIGVGDKILFLSGIKGIVTDIRELPNKTDIMLSKLSVWNPDKESSQRGGLLKEIEATDGYATVFYQPVHLRVNEIASGNPNMSSTMYPFLMQSKYMREKIELDNSHLLDMLRMGDTEISIADNGRLFFTELHTDDEETINGVYLPDFLDLWYVHQKKHLEYIVERTPIFNAVTERKITLLERLIQTQIRNYLRSTTKGVKGLIAITHTGKYNEIRVNPVEAKKVGKKVLVYREPVCEETSIQTMVVVADEKTPVGCARVHPYAIRAMNGDTDGDKLYILDYSDEYFEVSDKKYESFAKKLDSTKIVIPEASELKAKTVEEMIADAKEWHETSVKRAIETSDFGGKIKRATLVLGTPDKFAKDVMPYAGAIEGSLKDSKVKGKSGELVTLREKFTEHYKELGISEHVPTALEALFVKGKVETAKKSKTRTKSKWVTKDFHGKKLCEKDNIFYKWFIVEEEIIVG